MSKCWLAMVWILMLVSGCRTPPLETIDQTVADFVSHPMDVAPTVTKLSNPAAHGRKRGAGPANAGGPRNAPRQADGRGAGHRCAETRGRHPTMSSRPVLPAPGTRSWTISDRRRRSSYKIPKAVPGSEAPLVRLPLPGDPALPEATSRLFPKLPPLSEEPVPLPGPNGRPYTLAELHRIAAANSPALRQAASDVEAAKGLLKQAVTYPNPTIGFESGPNNNNTATGTQGFFIDQVIKTGGKLTLAGAQAQMNVYNAELALKRARSDLTTAVRTAYYNLLVDRETVRVNKALAHFTDEIFRLQADLLAGGFAGSHEPAALRSQAFLIRLAYKKAIANYIYDWKQLVAVLGVRQMPFSELEGQVDRLIPNYDYDAVVVHVLHAHTDVLTARNNLVGARYGLKLAQVIPVPDVEVRGDLWREQTIVPFQNFTAVTVSIPFPIWDQNKGNIKAAASALVRAGEGPHQVEVALTNGLAGAYQPYKTNLAAVEYYRRYVLPDQVRYYRGVFERRRIDPTVAFGDLVQAQQTLAADVTAYLGSTGSALDISCGLCRLYPDGRSLPAWQTPATAGNARPRIAAHLAVSPPAIGNGAGPDLGTMPTHVAGTGPPTVPGPTITHRRPGQRIGDQRRPRPWRLLP